MARNAERYGDFKSLIMDLGDWVAGGGTVMNREWLRPSLSIFGALALGPVFLLLGYWQGNFVYGLAALAYFFVCAAIVPLLVLYARRLRVLVWQLAVASLDLSVIADNFRLHAIRGREAVSIAYPFWVLGTLLSAPVPVYFLLKPLTRQRKYVVGSLILIVAAALYLAMGFVGPWGWW